MILYCQEVPYQRYIFIVLLSTVYQRFLFLRTILAASVDVSTRKYIFVSYFSRPISLENSRNLLIGKVPMVQFLLCDRQYYVHFATYLPSKIVLYSIYVIMYARGNQLTQTTDHGPRTTDHGPQTTHFKSFLLPDSLNLFIL